MKTIEKADEVPAFDTIAYWEHVRKRWRNYTQPGDTRAEIERVCNAQIARIVKEKLCGGE